MSTKQTGNASEAKQSRQAYKEARKKENKRRKSRTAEEEEKNQTRKQQNEKRKKPRRRIFPLWLRIIVVLILSAGALVAGLMIGFGVVGDGIPTDILKVETWQHIIDIVVGSD